jgi:LysM repeat protein
LRRFSPGPVFTIILIIAAFVLGIFVARNNPPQPTSPQSQAQRPANLPPPTNTPRAVAQAASATPSETIPPNTPLATLTPSRTLKPPPTFEPPTATLPPSLTPVDTATATLDLSVNIPGLRGNETATPAAEGCEPRKDWKLTYEVKRDDALARIADFYNTSVSELMKGNCLTDANVIRIGQVIKVPGKAHPTVPVVVCGPFEALTPFDGTTTVPGGGNLSFVWHGPRSPKTLLRIHRPDGSQFESVVELRQNEIVDAYKHLWASGTYKWQLFPLDTNFVQVCPESQMFTFVKEQGPTATPTIAAGPGGGS